MRISGLLRPFAAVAVLTVAGCEAAPPGNPLPDAAARDRIADVFTGIATGHEVTHPLAAAGSRGRWADVDLALYHASAVDGVEMAVVERTEHADAWVYQLKTIEGWPVRFEITRAPGERVYDSHAEVGSFPDLPQRRERARRLEEAFDRYMSELGEKRKLAPSGS